MIKSKQTFRFRLLTVFFLSHRNLFNKHFKSWVSGRKNLLKVAILMRIVALPKLKREKEY